MNKRCTNPSCRKNFSTLDFYGSCPYCGKEYPQLVPARKIPADLQAIRIMDYPYSCKVQVIKAVRDSFRAELGLKEAKAAVDHVPDTVFVLRRDEALRFMKKLEEFGCTLEIEHSCKKTDFCVRKKHSKSDRE